MGRIEQTLNFGPDRAPRRAVFLDRDGVLVRANVRNGRPYPPDTLDELVILPDVPEAPTSLREAGFVLIVVTNQPDVATGKQRRDVVKGMHDVLRQRLPVDDIEACFHTDADNCACRKPKPGMILQAASRVVDRSGAQLCRGRSLAGRRSPAMPPDARRYSSNDTIARLCGFRQPW